jgi:hypothetical protein
MRILTRQTIALLIAALLFGAATGWTGAQMNQWTRVAEPVVVSGDNVGFRIEWMDGEIPTGKIVVRVKGQWVEARVGRPPHLVDPPPAPPTPPGQPAPQR